MKVLYRGEAPPPSVWEGSCVRCTSVFEADVNELTSRATGPNEVGWFARCEVCGYPDVEFYHRPPQPKSRPLFG